MRGICVLAVGLVLALSTQTAGDDKSPAPTRVDVVQALRDMSTRDRLRPSQFSTWGDAALPHLRRVAKTSEAMRLGGKIMRAVWEIGTDKAVALYLDVLEGESNIRSSSILVRLSKQDAFTSRLSKDPRFKPAVVRYASSDDRAHFVDVCVRMGWVDMAPTLRTMLEDPRLDVREDAAKALRELTGEQPAVTRPELSFPRENLIEGLVGPPVFLPRRESGYNADILAFTQWFDGKPRFVYGWSDDQKQSVWNQASNRLEQRVLKRELRIVQGELTAFESFTLPPGVQSLQVIAPPGQPALLLANTKDPEVGIIARKLLCLTADGTQRWQFRAPTEGLKDVVPLYDETGMFGLALGVGSADGIVALDFEGKQLWRRPKQFVIYGLSTHPRAPGSLLKVAGTCEAYQVTRDSAIPTFTSDKLRPRMFLPHGVLLPNGEGRPSRVLAGKNYERDTPAIVCVGPDAKKRWVATLPSEVTSLVLLEPQDRSRLLVVTTAQGGLLVVDEAGTLLWNGHLPYIESDGERTSIYSICGGQHAAGKWSIAIKLLQDVYWIPINVARLPASGAK